MSDSREMPAYSGTHAAAEGLLRGLAVGVSQWAISQIRGLIQFAGLAVAVIWQGMRPLTWRRTVRAEFFEQCHQVGMRALPFILITGILVGLAIVYQTYYWLDIFG